MGPLASRLCESLRITGLPHPGLIVERKTWKGGVQQLDGDFLRLLDDLVTDLLEKVPAPRRIGRKEAPRLTPRNFASAVTGLAAAVTEIAPKAARYGGLAEMMMLTSALGAERGAVAKYTAEMDLLYGSAGKDLGRTDEETIRNTHTGARRRCLASFTREVALASPEQAKEARDRVEAEIAEALERYVDANQRAIEHRLTGYDTLATCSVSAFLADRLSDFLCDWWLEACRRSSTLFMGIYLPIWAFLGYEVYKIYRDRGAVAATVASLELGKAMTKTVNGAVQVLKRKRLEYFGGGARPEKTADDTVASTPDNRETKRRRLF